MSTGFLNAGMSTIFTQIFPTQQLLRNHLILEVKRIINHYFPNQNNNLPTPLTIFLFR